MKIINMLFFILIFLILISGISLFIINNIKKNNEIEKIEFTNNKMIKFEVEEKPAKIVPYEQKTDSRRYIKSIYEYFEKIQRARDKPIKK